MLYLEIGPLSEREFTGIPQVTAGIADQMLGDTKNKVAFFFGRQLIGNREVEGLLKRRNGERLYWYARRANTDMVPLNLDETSIGVFPNVKTARRVFNFEVQIFHDLSALLTPQFHTRDTIEYHALTARDDLLTNDLTICVSDATRSDTLRYLRPPNPERVITIHLGHAWPEKCEKLHQAAMASPEFEDAKVEPYVLILGTIEPRKNIGAVLDFLSRSPRILDSFRFVFVGRRGWGDQFEAYLQRHGVLAAYQQKKIVFTGYVPDQAKYSLMKEASLVVYPSLFEGFGLPVLEALSVGAPVLTTPSSSIPEVAGDACYYFDPFAETGFDLGFSRALVDLRTEGDALRARAAARGAKFVWSDFYRRMLAAIAEVSGDVIAT
jgi:glycosyltransferase involved in cell wall biosynthesis